MQTWRIHKHHLRILAVENAPDRQARRLRLWRHDRHFLAEVRVQQGRFAHVGPTQERHKTRPHNLGGHAGCWSSQRLFILHFRRRFAVCLYLCSAGLRSRLSLTLVHGLSCTWAGSCGLGVCLVIVIAKHLDNERFGVLQASAKLKLRLGYNLNAQRPSIAVKVEDGGKRKWHLGCRPTRPEQQAQHSGGLIVRNSVVANSVAQGLRQENPGRLPLQADELFGVQQKATVALHLRGIFTLFDLGEVGVQHTCVAVVG